MRKKIFSLLAVLIVASTAFATFVIVKKDGTLVRSYGDQLTFEQKGTSYALNGVDVKDIVSINNKVWNQYGEYERAFLKGYLDSKYSLLDRNKTITSLQFKEMLQTIIEKVAPDSLNYFNSRISNFDTSITRSTAAMMAYYVARCIGATSNNARTNYWTSDNFWEDAWGSEINDVLPYAHEPSPDQQDGWQESICALLWNAWHVSSYSNKEVIGYTGGAELYAWAKPFTWEDAVLAVTRLYDSIEYDDSVIEYASMDDSRVINPDSSIITPELIAMASKNEIKNIEDLPRLYGLPMGPEHRPYTKTGTGLDDTGANVMQIANWGFNSITFRVAYWYFFTPDMQANLNMLRALDELIAASMEYGVHFNLLISDIPGRGFQLQEHQQDDYIKDNDILNVEKREKDRKIWNALASRYKDVPNRYLSFTTIYELASALKLPSSAETGRFYTEDEFIEYQDFLIDAVREIDPDRFIIYDLIVQLSPNGNLTEFEELSKNYLHQYEHVSQKYSNTLPMLNLMDMPFAFYSYNNGDGNIDYARHSCWVPQYPVTLYDADKNIAKGEKLSFDGCLPKGTKFELFLTSAAGKVTASVDGNTVYEEDFGDGQHFNVGYAASWGHPYAKSDKKIAFELTEDAKSVTIAAETGNYQWSGMAVTLPESYSVQKWRHDEKWDVELGILKPEEYREGLYLQTTSTIEIPPTGGAGRNITILDNVTYTTDQIWIASNADIYDHYCATLSKIFGRWTHRVEDIPYSDLESNRRFFGDLAEKYQKYNADVWLPFYGYLFGEYAPYQVAGYKGEEFEGYSNFNLELLRILQKYQDK